MHVFHANSTRSHIVTGIATLWAIALICLAVALFDLGGLWILGGLLAFAAALAVFMSFGLMTRALGVRIEVDGDAIRATYRGQTKSIRWLDALTVSVKRSRMRKHAAFHYVVSVDNGRGTVIDATVPFFLGRAVESDAMGALTILEREAAVPLAMRQARRGHLTS